MTGIVIAAGRGVRMLPYAAEIPKCMLPVNGRPILSYAVDTLRAAGCSEIVIVTGHLARRIDVPGCRRAHNADYDATNVLHSLMYARDWFDDDLLITYSDILVEPFVYKQLVDMVGDITLAVDVDWRDYYVGRTEHGVEEAEKAVVWTDGASRGKLAAIGKHIDPPAEGDQILGEFTGLWKMSRQGAGRFRERFEVLDRALDEKAPFQSAREWRKAYVTDFLSELLAHKTEIECLLIRRSWAELDTVQDYHRLPAMVESQRLLSLQPKMAQP